MNSSPQPSSSRKAEIDFIDSSNVASTSVPQPSSSFRIEKKISELSTSVIQKKRKLDFSQAFKVSTMSNQMSDETFRDGIKTHSRQTQTSDVSTMSDQMFDETIRDGIKTHFKMYERLEEVINVYKKIIRQISDKQNDQLAQQLIKKKYSKIIQSHEELEFVKLAAYVSVWKEEYDKEKDYMDLIFEYIKTDRHLHTKVEENHPKFKKLMRDHYVVLLYNQKTSNENNHDKYTEDPTGKDRTYFTYNEEDSLLKKLHRWKESQVLQVLPHCPCRVCALIHFRRLACQLAKAENRPRVLEWLEDRNAAQNWLHEFEIRHKKYIYENFSSEEKCEKDHPNVALQTPDIRPDEELECAADQSSSTSVSQPSSQKEETLEPSPKKPRVSTMSDQMFDETIRDGIKTHFKMYERLEEVINVYKKIIRQISDKQNDQLAQQLIKKKYSKIIQSHEELEFVELAAYVSVWKEEYDNEKDCMDLIFEYIKTDRRLRTKVEKDHPKFKKLMDYYYEVALYNQKTSDEKNYDKYTEDPTGKDRIYFTYNEENLLLKKLNSWKESQKVSPSRICALVQLCTLAYKFAEDRSKTQIIELWKHEKADKIRWLHEFAIRHKKYIFENFSSEKECIEGDSSNVPSQIPDIPSNKESRYVKDEPLSPTSVSQSL